MDHFTLMNNDLQKNVCFFFYKGRMDLFFHSWQVRLKAMATPPAKLDSIRAKNLLGKQTKFCGFHAAA
jgi:hypothetical protein